MSDLLFSLLIQLTYSAYLFSEEPFAIRDAAFEVDKVKGCGFLKAVLQECMETDLICHNKISVEMKTAQAISDEHRAQLHDYLDATDYQLEFLINFLHHPGVETERVARSMKSHKESPPPLLSSITVFDTIPFCVFCVFRFGSTFGSP